LMIRTVWACGQLAEATPPFAPQTDIGTANADCQPKLT
jgi:hypothetical protein